MTKTRAVALCGILGLIFMTSTANAGCYRYYDECWRRAHAIIYHKLNHIAFLEADPNADDGFKGPIIDKLHHKVLRIRAAIGPRWPLWPTPCCYSRRPIYLR
jgi:hypothetical protein